MTMQDSGSREQFDAGAVRDTATGKPRLELISPFFLDRTGEWLRLGAEKYEDRNWEKGMPFSRVTASMLRHCNQWLAGDDTEDHLAAVAVNAMFLMHYQEMIKRGRLGIKWCDMPDFSDKYKQADEWAKKTVKLMTGLRTHCSSCGRPHDEGMPGAQGKPGDPEIKRTCGTCSSAGKPSCIACWDFKNWTPPTERKGTTCRIAGYLSNPHKTGDTNAI